MNFNFITKIFSIKEFKKLLMDRILKSFNKSFDQTNKEFGWNTAVNPKVIETLKLREIILSEKTIESLHGDLKWELLQALENNESITEVTNRLEKIFDLKRWQVERVARTETLYSQNAGEFHSQIQAGIVTHKVWKANIGNKRVGADSLRLHNQIQPIDKLFIDPLTKKECMHSPNRPNCRCSIQYLYEKPKNIIKKSGLEYVG